jgi:galactitol-specific phosphotransferase system IIB component
MKSIGIQKGLNTVKDYLQNSGYQTYEVDTTNKNNPTTLKSFDALIVTGMDDNEMGYDNTSSKIPVVNANGMTPEDVKNFLDKNLK